MKNLRAPAIPLITNDPYFSVWSTADRLYEVPTKNWIGKVQRLNGNISVDGQLYRFMGDEGATKTLNQIGCDVKATTTKYVFEGAGISLQVKFTSPLLLDDLELVSRPCTYMTFDVISTDNTEHDVKIYVDMSQAHCHFNEKKENINGGVHNCENHKSAFLGKAKQSPLNHSGDIISIDWGYLYLANPIMNNGDAIFLQNKPSAIGKLIDQYTCNKDQEDFDSLLLTLRIGTVGRETRSQYIVLAYDDISSINYFGDIKKGYWADNGETILQAIQNSVDEYDDIISRCEILDNQIEKYASDIAGEEYAVICSLAYRQSIAAHKLIKDNDGNAIFLSKECSSNGCIGTVDVSYPSIPLYLTYNPELVKAMMRPVFKFAKTDVWQYDFAPHDVGRYPYATGQVYGLNKSKYVFEEKNGSVYPFFYQFPSNSDAYELEYQMPVEECGNMLVMSAIALLCDGDLSLVKENVDLLEKWVCYLVKYGIDPGEQLCTDDFAGHLAHNANLSVKAIMGIAAYSIITEKLGLMKQSQKYYDIAKEYAQIWEQKVAGNDFTPLTFNNKDSWGQKYNLVWDKVFGTNLFSDDIFRNEIAHYKKVQNKYGLPLDSRDDYTKSDWILWCASLADDNSDITELIKPIYLFLQDTPDRLAFTDWYYTSTGKQKNFINRTVQGGLFMPIFKQLFTSKK